MSIKRILAAASASVVAVSSMAIVASAATYKEEYEVTVDAADVNIGEDGFWTAFQLGFVEKLDVTIEYTTADGTTGYADIMTNWGGDEAKEANAFTYDGGGFATWAGAGVALPEGVDVEGTTLTVKVTVSNIDDYVAKFVETYPENEDGTDMVMFKFGHDDAEVNKNVRAEFAEGAAPAEPAPENNTPSDENNAPADENNAPAANNVDTGVEGVAAVLGVAAVAAGAMIVAKKRK